MHQLACKILLSIYQQIIKNENKLAVLYTVTEIYIKILPQSKIYVIDSNHK